MPRLKQFDPESEDNDIKEQSLLIQKCWSPYALVYNPLRAGSIDGTDSIPHDKAIVRAQNADYRPNLKVKGRPECTIFIGRLSRKTTEHNLKEVFSRYGEIVRCRLIEDIVTGHSKGYAFIEYTRDWEAHEAYRRAHRMRLDGAQIFVDMECSRTLPGWVPRRLGGGFNGKKESGQLRFGGRDRPFKKPIELLTKKEIMGQFRRDNDVDPSRNADRDDNFS